MFRRMFTKKRLLILFSVYAVLLLTYWILSLETPLEAVDRSLNELEVSLSKEAGPELSMMQAARRGLEAAEFCTEEVVMELFPKQKCGVRSSWLAISAMLIEL